MVKSENTLTKNWLECQFDPELRGEPIWNLHNINREYSSKASSSRGSSSKNRRILYLRKIINRQKTLGQNNNNCISVL